MVLSEYCKRLEENFHKRLFPRVSKNCEIYKKKSCSQKLFSIIGSGNVSQIQTWDSCQSKNPQQFHTMRRSYVWGILYQLLVSYDLSIGSTVTKYIKPNTKTQNNIIISWIFLKKWFCYFGLFWNKMTEIQVFTKKSAGLVFGFLVF